MPKLRQKVPRSVLAVLSCMSLSGCGEVDLGRLAPKVWKPTAAVILVDHPVAWPAAQVESDLASEGAVATVVETTSQQLHSTIDSFLKNDHIGLIGIVDNGPVPSDVFQFAKVHPALRFEVVEKSLAGQSLINMRQVMPDPTAVAYSSGWLAGQASLADGTSTVGWLMSGQSLVPKAELKATLSGAYTANPKVNIVPVALDVYQAPTNALPKQMILTGVPSATELALLRANGSQLICLVPQPMSVDVLSQPALPDRNMLRMDVGKYAKLNWKAGINVGHSAPFMAVNGSLLSTGVLSAVNQCELRLEGNSSIASTAWSLVPQSLQQLWSPIVATGS